MLFAIPKAVFGLVLLLSSLFITTNAHPVHHTYRHGVGKPIRPKGWGWLGLHRGAKPDADEKHSHGQWRHGQGHHGHWRHGLHDHEVPAPKPGQSHADEEVRFGESRHRNGAVRVPQPAVSGTLGKFGGNETVPTGVDKMTPPRPRLTPLSTPTPASAE
ncbi:hypothetical protein HDK90DRAFT_469277 [Phyllosticta capitalensis]|uniref:Secreted protein n=1 Tax=Phyllosticta capitalensis TaxID=121624 RepID=A0ABR1YG23_9PEZI